MILFDEETVKPESHKPVTIKGKRAAPGRVSATPPVTERNNIAESPRSRLYGRLTNCYVITKGDEGTAARCRVISFPPLKHESPDRHAFVMIMTRPVFYLQTGRGRRRYRVSRVSQNNGR